MIDDMSVPKDKRSQALLLLYQGEATSTITELLGVTEEELEQWSLDASRAATQAGGLQPRRATDDERRADARVLLMDGDFVSVETPEEPGEPPNDDLSVFYNDLAAHSFQELVVESVNVIAAFPGVHTARHDDREHILVWGDADAEPLAEHLQRWWGDRLRAIAGDTGQT